MTHEVLCLERNEYMLFALLIGGFLLLVGLMFGIPQHLHAKTFGLHGETDRLLPKVLLSLMVLACCVASGE